MFNRLVIQKALQRSSEVDSNSEWVSDTLSDGEGSLTSLLIYDIFGGEILKTHMKKGWYFYNRIDGERVDFTISSMNKKIDTKHFEDLPSSPAETYNYFEQEEYSTAFLRFIRAYEEAVGLKKNKNN